MAEIIKQHRIKQLQNEQGDLLVIHPETDASVVLVDKTTAGIEASNVQDAIKEINDNIKAITGGGVVTGVKGDAETEYRLGKVNITKANIGLGNVDNTSDADKPVSTATQAALDLKEDKSNLKALAYKDSLSKSDVGLDLVNNVAITEAQVAQIGTNQGEIATLKETTGTHTSEINELKGKVSTNETNISKAQSKADEAYLLAEGRSRAMSFETVEAMTTYLKSASATEFRVGDNLYIKSVGVADYWVSAVLDNNNGTYGYYEVSILESTKVDLADYQKKALTTAISVNGVSKTTVEDSLNALNDYAGSINTVATDAASKAETNAQAISGLDSRVGKNETAIGALETRAGEIEAKNESQDTAISKAQDQADANKTDIANIKSGATKVGDADKLDGQDGAYYLDYNNLTNAPEIPTVPDVEVVVSGSGSFVKDIAASGHTITKTLGGIANSDLPNSGVTAGTYSAVTVNAKGIVTKGAMMFEVGSTGQTEPSESLAIGGLFFEEL